VQPASRARAAKEQARKEMRRVRARGLQGELAARFVLRDF
jgi:hypothetical protein